MKIIFGSKHKLNTHLYGLALSSLLLCPATSFALKPSAHKLAVKNVQTETPASTLKVWGYVDVSYNYLQRSNRFTSGIYNREFDTNENGFTLQQATITIAKQPEEGLGALANLILGRDAIALAPYGDNPNFAGDNGGVELYQAFLQYSAGRFTTVFGKFDSLAGAESINPNDNTNFSRSILDYLAIPGALLGVREVYTVPNRWIATLGLNNGWDNMQDLGRQKTVELSLTATVIPHVSLLLDVYTGAERLIPRTDTGPTSRRSLIDFVARWDVTDKIGLATAIDYAVQAQAALPNSTIGRAGWKGITGYFNYKFNSRWLGAIRAEVVEDQNGFLTGIRQNWREITLTLGYYMTNNFLLRAETRRDFSNVSAFMNKTGSGLGTNQQSYALEGVYKFSN